MGSHERSYWAMWSLGYTNESDRPPAHQEIRLARAAVCLVGMPKQLSLARHLGKSP